MKRLISLLAVAGTVGVLCASPAGADELSNRQLRNLFPGQFNAVVQGATLQFTARRGGRLIGHYMSSTDTGHWSVRGGKLCIVLDKWMNGKTKCSTVVAEGDWYRADDVRFQRASTLAGM